MRSQLSATDGYWCKPQTGCQPFLFVIAPALCSALNPFVQNSNQLFMRCAIALINYNFSNLPLLSFSTLKKLNTFTSDSSSIARRHPTLSKTLDSNGDALGKTVIYTTETPAQEADCHNEFPDSWFQPQWLQVNYKH